MDKKSIVLNVIKRFKERIKPIYNIKKIILFGSFARGDYNKWSDVDVIIVSDDFNDLKKVERPVKLYDYWTSGYPVDFLCYTPKEFNSLKSRVTIVREAVKEGIEI